MDQNSKEFKELKAKWDQKLKEEGLIDIEGVDHQGRPVLHRWHSQDFTRRNPTTFKATAEFFYAATHFLTHHKFESDRDRLIWQFYTEGLTLRAISARLAQTGMHLGKDTVNAILKRLIPLVTFGEK